MRTGLDPFTRARRRFFGLCVCLAMCGLGTTLVTAENNAGNSDLQVDETVKTGDENPVNWRRVEGEGAGIAFSLALPEGYELQGLGPEWYIVRKTKGRPTPRVYFRLKYNRTVDGMVENEFERLDAAADMKFEDGVPGKKVQAVYENPPADKYVEEFYLRAFKEGVLMITEWRNTTWPPFERTALSIRGIEP